MRLICKLSLGACLLQVRLVSLFAADLTDREISAQTLRIFFRWPWPAGARSTHQSGGGCWHVFRRRTERISIGALCLIQRCLPYPIKPLRSVRVVMQVNPSALRF
jgi:hypothetical protein